MDRRTVVVTKEQCMFGVTSGAHGTAAYRLPGDGVFLYGLPLDAVLQKEFGEGTLLRVTVEVVGRRRPLKRNPWLNEKRRTRWRRRS